MWKGQRCIVTPSWSKGYGNETDPICALQAAMEVMIVVMEEAIKDADIVVTATGNKDIVTADHMRNMKDRAIYVTSVTLIMKFKWKH